MPPTQNNRVKRANRHGAGGWSHFKVIGNIMVGTIDIQAILKETPTAPAFFAGPAPIMYRVKVNFILSASDYIIFMVCMFQEFLFVKNIALS